MKPESSSLPPPYRPLVHKMLLTIIIVSFVPVFLVSATIYLQFRHSYREKVGDHLVELVRKHKQQIDAYLQARLADVRFLADSFGYVQLSDEAFLQRQLMLLQQSFGPTFVDLGVINAEGHQVSYAGPFSLGKAHYAEAQWFGQAMKDQTVISDVFLGLRGLPHFIVATRQNMDGRVWILRATIDFVAFNNLVEGIRIGTSGFAFIVNRAGEFQTTPHMALHTGQGCFGGFLTCDEDMTRKIHVAVRPDEAGIESIYVTGLLKDRNWLLVYRQHTADAFRELRRAERISLLFFLLGGVSIVAMALVLSRRMVDRIAVADREKESMSRQVIESGKLASLGELAAGVAHEINNPVAVMIEEAGWIEDLMGDGHLEDEAQQTEIRRALKQINTQGKRCKEITRKLLSFARGSEGTNQKLDLNRVIEDVGNLVAQRAKYANVAVETRLEPELPAVFGSETEMHQVLLNLVNNALFVMEKEGGQLTVSSALQNSQIVISVNDTGPGIPKAVIDRIFDPFFTTKPVGQGTGLGLSICYGIVKKMGGEIEVISEIGKGTTFLVRLPVEAPAAT